MSEIQFQCELNHTWRRRGSVDDSKIRTGDVRVWKSEVDIVKCIEKLGAEFGRLAFPNLDSLRKGRIEIALTRSAHDVASRVAKNGPALRDWKPVWSLSSCGYNRRSRECCRVEVPR